MTLASDQNRNISALSATARRMVELRDVVFEEWGNRVRSSLPQAGNLHLPILINTMPVFYDNIAEALTPGYPRMLGAGGTSLASEHGGERARLTGYDHQALIGEYQIFRATVFEVLDREGVVLTTTEVMTINASIDDGIKEAVTAFALVHSSFRERFAAALTHDLRIPLSNAVMAVSLMAKRDVSVEMNALATKALDNMRRMDAMVHEILDTMTFHSGRPLTLNMSNIDLPDLLDEVRIDAEKSAPVVIVLDSTSVKGWWDRSSLKRALENVIGNAVKYGAHGGTITIRAVEIYDRLNLTVHNEGSPIPMEEQESIFQMYRRATNAQRGDKQGWGIGLPYVRAVAESHGGSVSLESTSERGTTFMIDIPIDARPYCSAASSY